MNKEKEAVDYWKSQMKDYSDAELFMIIHDKTPRDLQHVAAKIVLHDRTLKDLDEKHKQSMAEIVKANKLSEQSEKSAKQTMSMTKQILCLTWVIAILTAILLVVGFFEYPKKAILGGQKNNQTDKQVGQETETSQPKPSVPVVKQ